MTGRDGKRYRETRTMRASLRLPGLFSSALLCLALAAEDEGPPAWIQTRDGSRIFAVLPGRSLVAFAGPEGKSEARWTEISRLAFGERFDPALQAEARRTLKDLQQDDFGVRQKALDRLQDLGRQAIVPLREALASPDAEVAAQARMLLDALGAREGGRFSDELTRRPAARPAEGRCETEQVEARTRFGTLRFPIAALDRVEVLDAPPQTAPELPPAAGTALAVPLPADAPAREWMPDLDSPVRPAAGGEPPLAAFQVIRFLPHEYYAPRLRPGDAVEDLYAEAGLLIRPRDPNHRVAVEDLGREHGWCASVEQPLAAGDLELLFIQPGTLNPASRAGKAAGVHHAGVMLALATPCHVRLEWLDAEGRVLHRERFTMELPAQISAGKFFGARSPVPISRLRISRAPHHEDERLRLLFAVFSTVAPVERDARFARLDLRSGETLAGHVAEGPPPVAGAPPGLLFRPAFLPAETPAAEAAWAEVLRFFPAHTLEDAEQFAGAGRLRHAVLLQDGACFRATLRKLDEEQAALELAGGAWLSLPRGLLRKVDLVPERGRLPEGRKLVEVAEGEKPGVEFLRRKNEDPDAKAKGEDEGLRRMDDAVILEVDAPRGRLVVDPKDGGGAWPIDLRSARFLVFPGQPPAAGAGPRPWNLTLRGGATFAVDVKSVTARTLIAEMGGGKLALPLSAIECVSRTGKEPQP